LFRCSGVPEFRGFEAPEVKQYGRKGAPPNTDPLFEMLKLIMVVVVVIVILVVKLHVLSDGY
jgi:hypothetical protein